MQNGWHTEQIKRAFPLIIKYIVSSLQLAIGTIDTTAPSGGRQIHELRITEQGTGTGLFVCKRTALSNKAQAVRCFRLSPHYGFKPEGC
jgi:hypothetical protein